MSIERYYKPGYKIERSVSTPNGMGGHTEAWSTHLDISGLLDLLSSGKYEIAARFQGKATHIFICKTGYDITDADRLKFNNNIYRILYVDEPFKHHAEILLESVGVDNE